jgi:hypothetical protein
MIGRPIFVPAYFGQFKMMHFQLSDAQIRDNLYETATLIEKARHFVSTLADFVDFPENAAKRSQLIDASMKIRASLAEELDAMVEALA